MTVHCCEGWRTIMYLVLALRWRSGTRRAPLGHMSATPQCRPRADCCAGATAQPYDLWGPFFWPVYMRRAPTIIRCHRTSLPLVGFFPARRPSLVLACTRKWALTRTNMRSPEQQTLRRRPALRPWRRTWALGRARRPRRPCPPATREEATNIQYGGRWPSVASCHRL